MSSERGVQYVQTSQPVSLQEAPGSTPVKGVTVRHPQNTPEDCEFAAKMMVEAFADKIAHRVTKEKLPIAEKIITSYFQHQPPKIFSRILIAEMEGRRIGCLMLKFKGDKYNDSLDHICELGCWHAYRLMWYNLCVQITVKDRRKCLVDAVAVDSSARGRGVGKLLLDRAEFEARKEGCTMMYLLVLTTNRARSLYERHGYKQVGIWGNCCQRCVSSPQEFYTMEKPL